MAQIASRKRCFSAQRRSGTAILVKWMLLKQHLAKETNHDSLR
jgi:hypothetical protein